MRRCLERHSKHGDQNYNKNFFRRSSSELWGSSCIHIVYKYEYNIYANSETFHTFTLGES